MKPNPKHAWIARIATIGQSFIESNTAKSYPVVCDFTTASEVSTWLRETKSTPSWWSQHTIIELYDLGVVWHGN